MTKHPESAAIRGAIAGLGVVALLAMFALLVALGVNKVEKVQARPDLLRDWSTARVMDELGDYDQRVDCANFGLDGFTGYVYVKTDALGMPKRLLILCKP